jgi:predicted RNA methylase
MRTDPEGFDLIAREVFAPLYPVVAHQILCGTGVRRGRCLDVGTGPGLLGLALAQLTDLEVCLLDRDPEMLRLARRNVAASPLATKHPHGGRRRARLPFRRTPSTWR